MRDVWFVTVFSEGRWGVGECAPLPGLSCEASEGYGERLAGICREIERRGGFDEEMLRPYPSMLFGMETAFRHLEVGSFTLWDTPFSRGEAGIPINGLIWMGPCREMRKQIREKLRAGYRCIKLKIGALDFETEYALLRDIRREFGYEGLELRVDANGAFAPEDALEKLRRLSDLGIHSIEQPIRAGQTERMAHLAELSPIPIALDEELTGHHRPEEKQGLLERVRPQFLVLKPSLHGGYSGCGEWIAEAQKRGIGWWITSALESNIGLNAIAQWCATWGNPLPQGLGTGELFTNNLPLPIGIRPHSTPPVLGWVKDPPIPWDNGRGGEVRTSGSTGTPQRMYVEPPRMIAGALQTCAVLGLQRGDKALLCMPPQYIGAMMMVARTMVAGLELRVCRPSGHPLQEAKGPFRFAAMLPLQVFNSLQTPLERDRLMRIEILLVGGGVIDAGLAEALRDFPHAVYATYGMTETLSHIALRRLSGAGASELYRPLPGVSLSLSGDGALVIRVPWVSSEPVYTNDLAELLPGGFRILGRRDNVINSGGVKLIAEVLEEKLRPLFGVGFVVTSVPDVRLGEAVTLLVEEGEYTLEALREEIAARLSGYERPRHVCFLKNLPIAGNNKVDRKKCKAIAKKLALGQKKLDFSRKKP